MGHTHFLMKRRPNVKTEISLHILAYNMKRVMAVPGTKPLMEAIRAQAAAHCVLDASRGTNRLGAFLHGLDPQQTFRASG